MVLGALNPRQGSLSAGVTSLLYTLVPLLAFWIGRGLCTDAVLTRVLWVITGFAVVTALYGLAQTFVGFPSWDKNWALQQTTYAALGVFPAGGGALVIRPFGTFSSAAEYGSFAAIGLAILLAALVRRRWSLLALAVIALLGLAIFLEASRGIVVACIIAAALIWTAYRRIRLLPAVVLVAAAVLVVPLGLRLANFGSTTGGAQTLIGHQIGGLSNPFNPQTSTLGTHASLVVQGVKEGFRNPLGVGLSAVTIAGQKFGGTIQAGTEADPSNMAVALGLPGLAVYLVVLYLAFRSGYGVARRRRGVLSLAALGILAVTVLQWLNGGQYAVAWLPWLVLGWIDRPSGSD